MFSFVITSKRQRIERFIKIIFIRKIMEKAMRVEEGRTKLYVPHLDGKIVFAHPKVDPGTYANVGAEISEQGLIRPTMAQTASLVYSAFQDKDNKYSQEIEKSLEERWLWAFTGNRYVKSDNGVYIEDNPEIRGGKILIDSRDNLIKRLESNDNSVRLVPFGFKVGEQTSGELERNPYIVGLAGEEGAKKLAEVADIYKLKPWVFALGKDNFDNEETRVSALSSGWGVRRRLVVDGDYFGSGRVGGGGGCAFGVFDAEGNVNKK